MSGAQRATGSMAILCAYLVANKFSSVQRSEAGCRKESHQKRRADWVPCHQACTNPAWQELASSMLSNNSFLGFVYFRTAREDREVQDTHLSTRIDAPEHS